MKYTAATAAVLVGLASAAPAPKDCPAPGSTDAQGRYSCNPAHTYPDGQQCVFVDGCPFLRRDGPGVTGSAPPAPSATANCPAPGATDAQGRYSCNPAHTYPDGQQCVFVDGCPYLRRDGPGVTGSAPAAPPSATPNKQGQYANYGSYGAAKYASYGDYPKAGSYGSYGSYGNNVDPKASQEPPKHTPSKPADTPTATPTSAPKSVYGIKGFTERRTGDQDKYPGNVFFNITATNGGTLDFPCAAYNPATESNFESIEAGGVYFCGKGSQFSFSYTDGTNGANNTLFLWQGTNAEDTVGGRVSFADPICRAGGSGTDDFICTYPEAQFGDLTVAMRTL